MRVSIRDGAVHDPGSWLYVWWPVGRAEIVYVGATGLPPVLRTSLHLHDDDPEVAGVANRYPRSLTTPMEVLAFRLPNDLHRRAAKAELIRQLHDQQLIGADYVGDPPLDAEVADELHVTVGDIVIHLRDILTKTGHANEAP